METRATRARGLRRLPALRGAAGWARHTWITLFVLAAGVVFGMQVARPDRRVIQVLAAILITATALRLSSFSSLLILVVAFPFRVTTSYGSTTAAFTLLVFILWVARLTLRIEQPAGRSGIDLPVVALICSYLLSFSQFESAETMNLGLVNFVVTLVSIFFGYLVIHLTRTEKHLRQIVGAIVVLAVLLEVISIYELSFPSRALVPGWIGLGAFRFQEMARQGLEIKNFRVGSLFADFELFAEFCAMMLILLWFLLMRSRGPWARLGVAALLLLNTFSLLATVTRGALISLVAAAVYLAWKVRRRIRFHTLVIALAMIAVCGWVVFDVVAFHTRSGNILERMVKTRVQGFAPDDRALVWSESWERIVKRPVLGYGPYYGKMAGVKQIIWPHSVYLFYLHILGFVGLCAYLWILFMLWRATRHAGRHLGHPSYSESLLLALKAMFVLFVIDQSKIEYLRNDAFQYWVWLLFGLIVATSRIAAAQKQTLPADAPAPPANAAPRRLPAVSLLSGDPAENRIRP